MKPLRLAVIGGGVIGSKHAELIFNYQGAELVGITDIDKTVVSIANLPRRALRRGARII